MYKVLVIINVKMLEKAYSVTVNSTVYQNITAFNQLGRFHPHLSKQEKTALIYLSFHQKASKKQK